MVLLYKYIMMHGHMNVKAAFLLKPLEVLNCPLCSLTLELPKVFQTVLVKTSALSQYIKAKQSIYRSMTGPEIFISLRLPGFKTSGKGVSPTRRPPLPPGKYV